MVASDQWKTESPWCWPIEGWRSPGEFSHLTNADMTSTFWTPQQWPHQDWPACLQHHSSKSPRHASQTDYLYHLTQNTSLSLTCTIKSRTSTPTPHRPPCWYSTIHLLPLFSRTYIIKSLSRLTQLHSHTLPSVLSIPNDHNIQLISDTSSSHISLQRTINSTPLPDLMLLIIVSETKFKKSIVIFSYTEHIQIEIDGVVYKKDGRVWIQVASKGSEV